MRSGSFRLDRRRALRTLASWRFEDPTVFVDCWVRCAVASGAGRISFLERPGGLSAAFDAALPEAASDPWAAIFDPEAPVAARELAQGLLACLATGPARLVVESGPLRFSVESVERLSADAPGPPQAQTTLRAAWPRGRPPGWKGRLAADRFRLSPCAVVGPRGPVTVAAVVPSLSVAFIEGDAVRGWLAARPADAHRSLVCAYKLGVLAESFEAELPARSCVHVNDDFAELSPGLDRLAPEPRGRLLELARSRTRALVSRVLAWHAPRFKRAAALLEDPGLLEFWKGRSAFLPTGDDLDSSWEKARAAALARLPRLAESERRDLVMAGWTADWLHAAPAYGLGRSPLFFSGGGKTATLAELEAERRRFGAIRCSRTPGRARIWCPGARELGWLTRRFGEAIREE